MPEIDFVDTDPGVGSPGRSRELPQENEAAKTQVHVTDLSEYDFIQLTYHGDGAYRDGTLIRAHEREDSESYRGRREMAFLKNFFKPVVNARVDPVDTTNIIREVQDESGEGEARAPYFRAFLDNCDNAGAKIGTFMDEVKREGNLETLVFLVMDTFKAEDRSGVVAENLEKRAFPYVYMQNRDTVEGYSCDRHGKLSWIRFYDHTEKDASTGKETVFYRYWDKQLSKLQRKEEVSAQQAQGATKETKWIDVETVNHALNVLPVYPLTFLPPRKRTDVLKVDYEFYDLARCNWTIYNLDSATMEAIFDQCFSLLCIQGPKSDEVRVGTKTVCWVDMEAGNMPAFVSPDPAVAQIASTYAKDIKVEIFEIAEQNGVTAKRAQGVTEQSGKAKEWDFQAHGFILRKIAGFLRDAEIWIADTFKRYTGEKFIYVPHYRDDYAVTDSVSKIEVQEKVIENVRGPKAKALAEKNIVRIAFAGNSEEEVKPVLEELDQMETDEENATSVGGDGSVQDTALNGAQITSLVEIVMEAAQKNVPVDSARAIITAALPDISEGLIEQIISPISKFKTKDMAQASKAESSGPLIAPSVGGIKMPMKNNAQMKGAGNGESNPSVE